MPEEYFRIIVTKTNQVFAGMFNSRTGQFIDVVEVVNVYAGINETGRFVEAPRMIPFGSPMVLEPPTLDMGVFSIAHEIQEIDERYEKDYHKVVNIYKNPESMKTVIEPKSKIIH